MIKTELIDYPTSFCQNFKLLFFFSFVPSPEMRCLKLAHEADGKRVEEKKPHKEKKDITRRSPITFPFRYT